MSANGRVEQRSNWSGVTLPLNKRVIVSAVLHVGNQRQEVETFNYLLFGLIVSTK